MSLSNYLKPSISSSINFGYVAANWSAGRAAEFVNIGRNVVVALKSGPVETGPTILVAMALILEGSWGWGLSRGMALHHKSLQ